MGTTTCSFGGNPRPTKTSSNQITFRQTVVCDGPIDFAEVTLEIFVVPHGRQFVEFFDGDTDRQAPKVVRTNPYQSENVFELVSSRPCLNGVYVGRASATVVRGNLSDNGSLESIPVMIGGCSGPAGGPVIDPNEPPQLPPPPPPAQPSTNIDNVAASLFGKLLAEAQNIIRNSGFSIGSTSRQRSGNPRDTVISANPRADRQTIDVIISAGAAVFGGERFVACGPGWINLPTCSSLAGLACDAPGTSTRCRQATPQCIAGVFDIFCQ